MAGLDNPIMSNSGLVRMHPDDPVSRDTYTDLYQSGYNGFGELRPAQIHKVLENWAERVEMGDWEVGADGVGKFRDADSEECWWKYWVPLSW